ncbi:MAG: hypothetical protein JWQ61_2855 [Collimonas fungivorans]|uniref:hypothetical protein n=1 Tax=Collimonas fungivorans TaxID=158899 RepID=UPI0026F11251|nr:hypothetical protein [Collimonas fungivorans]MDB5768041.1 hypothetical protein [Collimonas fungivorans]
MGVDSRIPSLAPLQHSHDANALEAELKQLVLFLFETHLRDAERELNVYGVPHLGSLPLIERHVKREGLALIRTEEPAMRYLYKAWRARNPKRGLHFLRMYLQLLWPNGWIVEQLWQDKNKSYPTALSSASSIGSADPSATHYLTSRIRVSIDDEGEMGMNIPMVAPALRAVIAAKYVLQLSLLKRFENEIGLFNGAMAQQFYRAEGEVLLPSPH